MGQPHRDIIAAIATPPGSGGVGIVRISGAGAADLTLALFRSPHPTFEGFKPYRLHHGWLLSGPDPDAATIDEVLAAYMPGPGSYTGEDVVEINCHGGVAVLHAVLSAVYALGARPAERGEFTKRAFLNGKLDLTQAEAVAELVAAPTRAGCSLAAARLQGDVGRAVEVLRERLLDLRQQFCLAVDFPEEDVECAAPAEMESALSHVETGLRELLEAGERTRPWREGVLLVLAGQVNAGKSSLFNAILGRARAIVTDVPGTTRDYLEESVSIKGLPVRLVDTAGLRHTGDIIEQEGMRLSRDLADQADLVLLVADGSRDELLQSPELELLARLEPSRVIVAANKCDKTAASGIDQGDGEPWRVLPVSAATGEGLDVLLQAVLEAAGRGDAEPDPGQAAPNARQARLLEAAREEVLALLHDLSEGTPYDLLSVRLDAAAAHLADITGATTPEDVLNAIFDSFCIGK